MMNIFSIYDSELKSFGNLILLESDVILKRQLVNLLNSAQNPYKGFEDKFEVYKVGEFNKSTCIVNNNKELLFKLSDILGKNIDIGGK